MSGLAPVGGSPIGASGSPPAAPPILVEVIDGYVYADAATRGWRTALIDSIRGVDILETHLMFDVTEGHAYAGAVDVSSYIRITDAMIASDVVTSRGTFRNDVVDGFSLHDAVGIVLKFISVDGFMAIDSVELRARYVIAVVDSLLAADIVTSKLSAVYVLASAFAAEDTAAHVIREDITDSVAIADILANKLKAYHAIFEPIVMADSMQCKARFVIPVVDGFAVADLADSKAIMFNAITEGVAFAAALDVEGGNYYAWVVDAESRAAWHYDNFGFNSFGELGGYYIGAMHDGVYELEGDDDAGVNIDAVLRTGLMNFGTSAIKRPSVMYVCAKRDGDLVAKVFMVAEDGGLESHWYRLEGGPATAIRADRVEPDGGLESVLLQFELINIDGADFDIDEMRVLAVALNRRY